MTARPGVLLCLLTLSLPALADEVRLKSGATLEGDLTYEETGVRVTSGGASVWLPHDEIATVTAREPKPQGARRVRRHRATTTRTGEDLRVEAEARALEGAWRRGDTAAVSSLLGAGKVWAWNEAKGVDVSARFGGSTLTLKVKREKAAAREPIAVAFPPGTFGEPVDAYVQDLVLTRAPVLVVPTGSLEATLRVPVACAKHSAPGPRAEQAFELDRYDVGSPIDRLMAAICKGEELDDADAQLAVWIVHNDVRPDADGQFGGGTFSGRSIGTSNQLGAARLIEQAGLHRSEYPFFAEVLDTSMTGREELNVDFDGSSGPGTERRRPGQ